MAGNGQQQSWGSFLGGVAYNTVKYTVIGTLAVGAVLVGGSIVANALDAFYPDAAKTGLSYATSFGDKVQGLLNAIPGVGDFFGITGDGKTLISAAEGTYKLTPPADGVSHYLGKWSQNVDTGIGEAIKLAANNKIATAAIAGTGAVAGSWAQKVMDQRAARAQGVEIA